MAIRFWRKAPSKLHAILPRGPFSNFGGPQTKERQVEFLPARPLIPVSKNQGPGCQAKLSSAHEAKLVARFRFH